MGVGITKRILHRKCSLSIPKFQKKKNIFFFQNVTKFDQFCKTLFFNICLDKFVIIFDQNPKRWVHRVTNLSKKIYQGLWVNMILRGL